MPTAAKRIGRKIWHVFAALVILAALMVSITRLLTPVLNDHRADFEKLASDLLQMPVLIREVQVAWHGYSPEIMLYSVIVLDPDTQKPKVNMDSLEIDFSIWQTLMQRKIAIRNITVSGMDLTITQASGGEIQIGALTSLNIKDTLTGSSVHTDEVFAWVFAQPRLALENINVIYVVPNQDPRSITLKLLSLKNTGTNHLIDGKAILNQELPVTMDVRFSWTGDVRHLEQAKGNFYLYLESLSLRQWFSKVVWNGVRIKKGLASVKLWGSWSDNQWQKFQTTFQAYDVELYSDEQKRGQTIDRFRGMAGWRRDADTQVFSGEQIYLDFPYHLWPAMNFSVRINTPVSNQITLKSVQFNYLSLADVMKIVSLAKGLFPDSIQQQLITLAPRGEIHNVKITVPEPLTDISQLELTGTVTGLSLNQLKSVPGITNFQGGVEWHKNQGSIKLASTHAFLSMDQAFLNPVYFDQLSANVAVQRSAEGDFSIQAKNINLASADLVASTVFTVNIPHDQTPDIDFSAQFHINNIAHLYHYLPLKVFDKDLTKWLQNAFKSGETGAGTAEIKGKLVDFPFEANNGKFMVTTQLKNMDLNYAPDWPDITELNGDLTFAGRAITIEVLSGNIGAVPVKKIIAFIPYVGDAQPQILHVDGLIEGDLTEGLTFIHQSPLQKTVGKDLAGMNLTGGMQLKLGLVVPLKHPDNTTVSGAVTMSQAALALPQWKITFDKLNGLFQFNERGIEAKALQGQLFGAPATLDLTTLYKDKKSSGQVQATITGAISIPALEKWAGVNMSSVAQGSANYQAQLLLASHNAATGNQIAITTNLQGVAINLPAPFAKKAVDSGSLKLDISSSDDGFKTKINYNKQISAALNLKTANQKTQLLGGEIRFGGDADWQTSPGMLISGTLKQLDWDTWQNYINSLRSPAAKTASHDELKMLRGIKLTIGDFAVLGQHLHQVNLDVTSSNNNWNINLASNELGGQITVPFNLSTSPVEAQFQHITLDSSNTQKMKQKMDPRTLPAINIESASTQLGDMHIGHLNLNLVPDSQGLIIKQLSINEPLLTLNATGEWTLSNGGYSSHLEGSMATPKASDVLTEWGFHSSNFVGTKGEVKFNLNWPDAPYDLTLKGLSGNVSFNFGEGRIVELSDSSNAKIGLGRMLNLFSLSTIPRRLSLNFSDVTQKGFSFDYMKADFTLKNGSAFTENMRFNGPIARVEIQGRVGLVAKDFFRISSLM